MEEKSTFNTILKIVLIVVLFEAGFLANNYFFGGGKFSLPVRGNDAPKLRPISPTYMNGKVVSVNGNVIEVSGKLFSPGSPEGRDVSKKFDISSSKIYRQDISRKATPGAADTLQPAKVTYLKSSDINMGDNVAISTLYSDNKEISVPDDVAVLNN